VAVEVQITPDRLSWDSLERALKAESRGFEFLAGLEKDWRAAGSIAAADARRSARSIAAGRSQHAVSLRSAIAAGVQVHTYMGARAKGKSVAGGRTDAEVAIAWHRRSMARAVRGVHGRPQSILWRAGWLLNKGRRWSHPVFGLRPNVVTGVPQGKGWFDDSLEPHLPGLALVVRDSYEEMIRRINARSVSA
jgi:hypothetical protein